MEKTAAIREAKAFCKRARQIKAAQAIPAQGQANPMRLEQAQQIAEQTRCRGPDIKVNTPAAPAANVANGET